MALQSILAGFVLATTLGMGEPPNLPHSERPVDGYGLSQVFGGYCQTQYGVCPLIDANGQPYQAPVGQPCSCGSDPGTVIQ